MEFFVDSFASIKTRVLKFDIIIILIPEQTGSSRVYKNVYNCTCTALKEIAIIGPKSLENSFLKNMENKTNV